MSEKGKRKPEAILNEIEEWIDLSQPVRWGSKPLDISFGDGSTWLHVTKENGYQLGKLVGWLEALSYVEGKSFIETKDYLKKLGLYKDEKHNQS